MKLTVVIVLIAAGLTFCSEDAKAQDRNHAKQTVSFGVNVLKMNAPAMQGTITVAPLAADSKPSSAVSLRFLIPLRPVTQNDIPLREISSKLASRELLVTISD